MLGLAEDDELADVTVIGTPRVTVITQGGAREQVMQLTDTDLQNHFGKRARMGKQLTMKGKAFVAALKP